MKQKTPGAVATSMPTWETLEPFVRAKIQATLQDVLEAFASRGEEVPVHRRLVVQRLDELDLQIPAVGECDRAPTARGLAHVVKVLDRRDLHVEKRADAERLRDDAPVIPEGYFWQIDGQLFIEPPTPVEDQSWGGLKKRFQGGN